MARRPQRSLRPAFVVVAALASAACGPLEGTFLDPSPTDEDTREPHPCDNGGCTNPPPPEPIPPPAPDFGATVSQTEAPPALGAATLVVGGNDGNLAIGSDPDRDRVVIVDVPQKTVKSVPLTKGDEPGRIALDASKRAHVVLRGAGSVAAINIETGAVLSRRSACPAPRGITLSSGKLFVACAGGELVSLPLDGGAATQVARLDRDLRDIVSIANGVVEELYISRLRSAEVLRVALDGSVLSRRLPPTKVRPNQADATPREPGVAWRMVKTTTGVRVVHQAALPGKIETQKPAAYASLDPCGGPVTSTTSTFTSTTSEIGPVLGDAVVPVDLAVSADGSKWAVISAGNAYIRQLPQIHVSRAIPGGGNDGCMLQPSSQMVGFNSRFANTDPVGEHVAAAYQPNNTLLVLSREPAALHVRGGTDAAPTWSTISLGGESKKDTGHAILHANTGFRIACASCHPEGGDDGRTWSLSDGLRRTQSLRGTLEGTGPYHWKGDLPDLATLTKGAFSERMGGPELRQDQVDALAKWIVRIPALPSSTATDAAAAARGKTLFESATTKCATCHSGARLTNNATYDVGTGEALQVPSLVGLAFRAPYMHNGCAKTMLDRFDANCGGGDKHGTTSQLTAAEKTDLSAYLESL